VSDGLLIDLTDYRILGGTSEVTLLGTGTGQIVMIGTDVLDHAKLVERESRTLHLAETLSDTVIVPVLDETTPNNADGYPIIGQQEVPIRRRVISFEEDGPHYCIRAGYSPGARTWFVRGAVEQVQDQHAFIRGA